MASCGNVKSGYSLSHRYAREADAINQKKLKGVIFDLDGTLVRSAIDFPNMKRRMISLLEAHGIPRGLLSPQETTVETLAKAETAWEERGTPEEERRQVRAVIDDVMNKTELEAVPTVQEVKGAAKAIRRLKEMGHKLAVLTRGHHIYAVEALRKTGMLEHLDLILGRGETPRPKPFPEALLYTAERMGLKPGEVIFVGDHPMDSTCAENAGIRFLGVLSGWAKEETWAEQEEKKFLCSVRDLPDYVAMK